MLKLRLAVHRSYLIGKYSVGLPVSFLIDILKSPFFFFKFWTTLFNVARCQFQHLRRTVKVFQTSTEFKIADLCGLLMKWLMAD